MGRWTWGIERYGPRQERGGEGPSGKRAGDDDELENKSWRVDTQLIATPFRCSLPPRSASPPPHIGEDPLINAQIDLPMRPARPPLR